VPAAHPGAEIEQMRGRDQRLRQPADQQQLALMASVGPVGLRALLLALQRARLRRLSEMHIGADPPRLLDHEPPARRGLQRHLEILTRKPPEERPDPFAVRRRDPRAGDLPRDRVDPLRGDCARC
jgi:hypothetical protein